MLALVLALALTSPAAAQPVITWDAAPSSEVPIQLTASDGTGLELTNLTAHSVVQDPLAFTELRLTFHNPEQRVREGRFAITLPQGADVSRFAMKINGQWQEGEVVEKQRARRIYEDFLHRRQDPALLEKAPGNQFTARVFPIPAGGTKELVLSFSQELVDAEDPLTLPLGGLPRIDDWTVEVDVDDGRSVERVFSFYGDEEAPDGDLSVALGGAVRPVGLQAGAYHVLRVAPELDVAAQPVRSMTVLVDTSASRALGADEQVARVEALLHALPRNAQVRVVAFDQQQEVLFAGRARDFDARALAARSALGASDLAAALTWVGQHVDGSERVLLVGDGVATAGATDTGALEQAVGGLARAGVTRLDALVLGGLRDEGALRALTTGELRYDGVLLDGELEPGELARRLSLGTRSVEVSAPGAAWVWPQVLHGLQPGDEALVYTVGEQAPQVQLDGRSVGRVRWRKAQQPLLERATIGANLERLGARRDAASTDAVRASLTAEITELSVRYRVITDETALLVLETEQDYARYGLARVALADILVVGDAGVERVRREVPALPKTGIARSEEAPEVVDDWTSVAAAAEGGDLDEAPMGASLEDQESMEEPMEADAVPPRAFSSSVSAVEPGWIGDRVGIAAERRRAGGETAVTGVLSAPPPEMREEAKQAPAVSPWSGEYDTFRTVMARGDVARALAQARAWRERDAGDVLALVALGEALAVSGAPEEAARAYGSLIDLYPGRADMRRMAAQRLESLGEVGLALAADSYGVSVEQRPDHLTGYRLHALVLAQLGDFETAFAVLEAGLTAANTRGRAGVEQVLRETLGLVGAAWIAAEPKLRDEIVSRAQQAGAVPPAGPSTRFVLCWETDANDVDLHVLDGRGGHAYYSQKQLPSGGSLVADVTNGFGPESFVIAGTPDAGPYTVSAHYYSRGPMGYGMGQVQVVRHDGMGGLEISAHPFVVMVDQATVDVVTWSGGEGEVATRLPDWVR